MTGCLQLALLSAAFSVEAQITMPLVPAPLAPTGAAGVHYGCPWLSGNDAGSNNTGYVDTQATYRTANIPVSPPAGAVIRVHGQFPKARYLSFQTYDGFRPGNTIDRLPDAWILPDQGGTLDPNPAALPQTNGYTYTYTFEVRFEAVPKPPLQRARNVLYAGVGSDSGALSKQIGLRIYYPNTPGDKLGGVPLPDLTYVGPDGREIDLNRNSPDQPSCNATAYAEQYNIVFPTAAVGQGQSKVAFRPVTAADSAQFYPNPDSSYLRAQIGRGYDDLILVRQLAQKTPVLPPLVASTPDTRYWSVCMYQVFTSAVTGCIADTQMSLQPDGSYVTVISVPEKRPAFAYPQYHYNWLPFGTQNVGLVLLRQILVRPGFDGDYARAVANPTTPVSQTLGIWAPQITYCDAVTFAANAASGGAAAFSACKLAADRRALLHALP